MTKAPVSTSVPLLEPCRILSLDGGGAKGFYTLGVLKEIEAVLGQPLHERFDLIFGTSSGAIIAALLALRDRVSAWRAGNAAKMLSRANTIYLSNDPNPADQLSPRLADIAIEEASWIDDDQIQDMWSGLLASSAAPHDGSEENLILMNLLKQLSSLEVKMLRFAIEEAPKEASPHGFAVPQQVVVPTDKLPELFDIQDLQRIDRELDHLRALGLIGFGGGGGILLDTSNKADLTPSPLGLDLYLWLVYRTFTLRAPKPLTWRLLYSQFGAHR